MKVSMVVLGAILVVAIPLACGQRAAAPATGEDVQDVPVPPAAAAPSRTAPRPAQSTANEEDPPVERVVQRPALPPTSGAPSRAVSADTITMEHCLVSLIEEAQVPAEVPALEGGKLVTLKVERGQLVKEGDLLAQVDDRRAQLQHDAASARLAVAQEKAKSTIGVRYATAAAKQAHAELNVAVKTNEKIPGTVPWVEVKRLELTWHRAYLEIEQAELQEKIDDLEVKVSQAELDAANESIKRYTIISPMDALVRELYRHPGEWVKPGDPVMHIIRMDKLWIKGFLDMAKYDHSEVIGKPVTVTVALARGRIETFQARVKFVDPGIQSGGDYPVWAEVQNRQLNGQYVLFPGMPATMIIHLK